MQSSNRFSFLIVIATLGFGGFLISVDSDFSKHISDVNPSLSTFFLHNVWAHDEDGDGIDDDNGLPLEDDASDDTFLLSGADFASILNGSNVEPPSASTANGTATLTWSKYQERLQYTIHINGLNLDPSTDYNSLYQNVTGIHIHFDDGGSDPHALNIFGLPTEDDNEMTFTTNGTGGTITGIWGDNDDDTSGSPADVGRGKQLSDMRDELCNGQLYFQVHSTPGLTKSIRGSIDPVSPLCEFDLTKEPDMTVNLSDATPISMKEVDDITDASGSGEFWYNANQTQLYYRITFDGVDVGHGGPLGSYHLGGGTFYQDTIGHGDGVAHGGHSHGAPHLPILLDLWHDDAQLNKDISSATVSGVWDDSDAELSGDDYTRSKKLTDYIDLACANDLFLNFTRHGGAGTDGQYFLTGHIHGHTHSYCAFDPLHVDFTSTINQSQIGSGTGSSATGTAKFTFANPVKEANLDEDNELSYEINLLGLDSDHIQTIDTDADDLSAIHIHNAPSGQNSTVHLLNIYGTPARDDDDYALTPGNGTITGIWDDGDVSFFPNENGRTKKLSKSLDQICDSNGYLNIHTEGYPSGEIRGQITPTSDNIRCDFDLSEPDFVATLNATNVNATGFQTSNSTASAEAKFFLNTDKTKLHYVIDFSHDVDTTGHNVATNGQTIDTVNDDLYRIHLHFGGPADIGGSHAFNILRPNGDTDNMKINNGTKMVSGVWNSGDASESQTGKTLASVFGDLCSENIYVNVHSPDGTPNAAAMVRGQIEPSQNSTLCDAPSLISATLTNSTAVNLLFNHPVNSTSLSTGDFTSFDLNGTSILSVTSKITPAEHGLVTLRLSSAVDSMFNSTGTVSIASSLTSDLGIPFNTSQNPITITNPVNSPMVLTASASTVHITSGSQISKLSIPHGISSKLDLSSSISTPSFGRTTVSIPSSINATVGEGTSNQIQLKLPQNLQITGNTVDFDGVLSLPSVASSCGSDAASCVEIGSNDAELDLSAPVQIILSGEGSKQAFYVTPSGARTLITSECPSPDDPGTISSSGPIRECKVSSGGDLVIWTTHFTSFGSLTPSSSSGNSSGGGRGGIASLLAPNLVLYNMCDESSNGAARVILYHHSNYENISVDIHSGDFHGYATDVSDTISYLTYVDKSNSEGFTYRVFDAIIPSDIDYFWVGVFTNRNADLHVPYLVQIPKNTCQGFDEAFPLKEDAQFIKPFEPLEISNLSYTQELILNSSIDNNYDDTKPTDKNSLVGQWSEDISSEPIQSAIDPEPILDSISPKCGPGTIEVNGYCKLLSPSNPTDSLDSEPVDFVGQILKWFGIK